MRSSFAGLSALALAGLMVASPSQATISTTSPIGSTVGQGGQNLLVSWHEDNTAPLISSFGPFSIDLYTGGHNAQTWLQNLATNVAPSTTSGNYHINPSVGPSGLYYFIRYTGANKDPSNPNAPLEAFSAKFALQRMTGTFNQTTWNQINNVTASSTSAGIGGTSTAAQFSSVSLAHESLSTATVAPGTSSGSGSSSSTAQKSKSSNAAAASSSLSNAGCAVMAAGALAAAAAMAF